LDAKLHHLFLQIKPARVQVVWAREPQQLLDLVQRQA